MARLIVEQIVSADGTAEDAEGGMSTRERIAHHVDADDAQMAAIAERYGCPDPLKPGAPMYYFTH